ncbi:tripartite tricarboxylate transporter TctB family protein [Sporosarcina thermotolerans]|uniref:Tripartite tricarboxylate transporter TctB family protein n=1 Tax=Sporosarcina thermotolerans TaxID=633404 RepID=A0AAW9AAB1_9BACL|nr:tripartite tricarboxylate transporter TctB family protein [Sporosarcina thermotolerans]MDW0116126.1 tripartite tricarboxylate transporter TctB family protein [Sporosarcina thermotolerans]WHT48092.1 tripartite tricarboxylate transporter TctB family protein [Sporosarcina thermotolerans]
MVPKIRDVQSGIFLLVVSVIMFSATLSFKKLTSTAVGPAFMPQIIAGLIALMAIAIIIQGIRSVKAEREKESSADAVVEKDPKDEVTYRPVILSFILMAVYVVVLPFVGFLITTAVYMFTQMMILSDKPERRWLLFAVVSVVSSATIYYVFRNVFYVMLPNGFL